MPKPQYHIFVCTNTRPPGHPKGSCGEKSSEELLMNLTMGLIERNLMGKAVVTGATCLGPCDRGTSVVIYPDGVWYQQVGETDIADILDQHIGKGEPVDRLRMPDDSWD
ncbi:MAG: ferredoxin [Nitrospiraceae bacterium]|nr:ferredoxin [Nitrospiraceae bacterium]